MKTAKFLAPVMVSLSLLALSATAQVGTFQLKSLTPETALKAAQAAIDACNKQGFQVAVAVTDRSGVTQVLLRDRFAGPHTVEVSTNKAWTALTFRTSTKELGVQTQANSPSSGLRNFPRFIPVGGGLPIEAGGNIFGSIGVSGGPSGDADESCAKAGIKAISDAIEF
ncbi:MAG: heme-binding protein [Polaromonas sp.]|nr:heme-binding protein [Polaromonas sp.]